jgi:hypothetical protein
MVRLLGLNDVFEHMAYGLDHAARLIEAAR